LVTGTFGYGTPIMFVPFIFNIMNYDKLFHQCAEFLRWLANETGMTYKEVNVWIFIIIEPIVFMSMLLYIIYLNNKLYHKSQQV